MKPGSVVEEAEAVVSESMDEPIESNVNMLAPASPTRR
jgi:hypothetical protein